jgi:lipoyl(octanoyl) transferase
VKTPSGRAAAAVEAGTSRRPITVRRLGLVDYTDGLALQSELVAQRKSGEVGDTLLLLEHPPVITLGAKTRGKPTHIIATDDELRRSGVTVHETGRGGDVTYHGPGQLVGYQIFDLQPDRADVHRYVRDLEAAIIVALGRFGIAGKRVQGLSGVWVGPDGREEKIAAIGVRISRWITSHGFALNVEPDLRHFQLIVPCGIADRGVTSMARVLGRSVSMSDVEDAIVDGFNQIFEPSN